MGKQQKLFCLNLGNQPQWLTLLVGVSGVFSFFILQGTANEKIFKDFHLKESLFLTFIQFFCYASLSFSFFIDLIHKKTKLHAPFHYYLITSLALVGSMALSNYSLERINFPTQVLFRSSKLIPVMIGSILFNKKKHKPIEFVAALFIVIGLIGVSVGDKLAQNRFDTIGLISVILSLIFDAFASNLEERAFDQYNAQQNEVIAMIYLIGSVILLISSLITGHFMNGIRRCNKNKSLIGYILIYSYLGALGIQFVYLLINNFGSVVSVTITSLRKGFTVFLSFAMDPNKKFTKTHLWSVLFIAIGIMLNIINKRRTSKQKVILTSPAGALTDQNKGIRQ